MVRICRAVSIALRPYSRAVMWPICQGPSISFPRHQERTLCGCSKPCSRRRSLHLVPPGKLQYSTSAAVVSGVPDPRLVPISGSGAHHFAPGEKFIGAELIRLDRVPCAIENARTFCARTDAVQPVIAGDEVTARVTYDRHAHRFDFGRHVFAVTLRVCQRRSRLIDAPVYGASQVFDEAAEKSPIDHRPDASGIDHYSVRRLSPKKQPVPITRGS